MLAPLVMNRKGFYTDLAKWALGKGVSHLRVDGEYLPTNGWPRLDRFREHTIELPVAQVVVTPDNEKALRAALAAAIEVGKGVRARVLRRLGRCATCRSIRPSAPAARAAAASPSSTRGSSRTTPSTAGARLATARA